MSRIFSFPTTFAHATRHSSSSVHPILPQVLPLTDDTISIRSLDWDRDRFDIEFGLEKGTTYNSYLIMGDKTALVDASHEKFHTLYLDTLDKQLQKLGEGS
jgi:flavorubredoxin